MRRGDTLYSTEAGGGLLAAAATSARLGTRDEEAGKGRYLGLRRSALCATNGLAMSRLPATATARKWVWAVMKAGFFVMASWAV